MKLRLLLTAAAFALSLTGAAQAELKFKPGEGPFNWANFEDLKKMDLKGEQLTIFGPWRGDDESSSTPSLITSAKPLALT
jgi:alpha-glucoside transport system substrate-binding protein